MKGPAKNRLHDYEAGWLTLLVAMRVATREEAQDAMYRVAQSAIDEIEEKRKRRRERRRRRRE
jgi:signal transduction histidine kinase